MLNTLDLVFILSALFISLFGFYLRARKWRIGLDENRCDKLHERIIGSMRRILLHGDILREKGVGYFHLFVFYIFLLAIMLVIIFQLPVTLSSSVAAIQSVVLDAIGLLSLIGVLFFFYRRLYVTDKGFDNKKEDFVILSFLLAIILTGFILEGVRIRATGGQSVLSPVGTIFSAFIPSNEALYPFLSRFFWRLHFFFIAGFIAYIPFSKMIHVILIPLSYAFCNNAPKGVYKSLDLDNAEEFGANKLKDLTWKDLMDLETCVRCGRCQENCPAFLTEKPLSPKKLIQDLRKILENSGKKPDAPLLTEEDVSSKVVFACTTCRACMENCPAGIEHLDKMIELKRYLVLMEGSITPEAQLLFKNLERNGNPWGMPATTRGDWAKDLGIPELGAVEDPAGLDFLFWPGCSGAFDDRYMKVVKRCVEIFKKAGIKFAVLGGEESCCGDPGRKLGNEYLYDMLARQNVETMNGYGVKNIVTSCPHCFNTISKDYVQIGGNYSVKTHTEVILGLIKSGQLKLSKPLEGNYAYHDSCYLARYNNICEEPRDVIKETGLKLVEFERRGIKGFCCGGGGGNMFLEEHAPRMNETRITQIIEDKSVKDLKGVAVACPFCLTMMVDGTKTFNREDLEVKDVAELVYDAME